MNAAAPVQIAVHAVPVAKARPRVSATGVVWPTGRPDTDNITKAALDALNGMVVRDDAQVVEIAATKRYRAATRRRGNVPRPSSGTYRAQPSATSRPSNWAPRAMLTHRLIARNVFAEPIGP